MLLLSPTPAYFSHEEGSNVRRTQIKKCQEKKCTWLLCWLIRHRIAINLTNYCGRLIFVFFDIEGNRELFSFAQIYRSNCLAYSGRVLWWRSKGIWSQVRRWCCSDCWPYRLNSPRCSSKQVDRVWAERRRAIHQQNHSKNNLRQPVLNGYIYPKQIMKLTLAKIIGQPKL